MPRRKTALAGIAAVAVAAAGATMVYQQTTGSPVDPAAPATHVSTEDPHDSGPYWTEQRKRDADTIPFPNEKDYQRVTGGKEQH